MSFAKRRHRSISDRLKRPLHFLTLSGRPEQTGRLNPSQLPAERFLRLSKGLELISAGPLCGNAVGMHGKLRALFPDSSLATAAGHIPHGEKGASFLE